MQVEPVEVVALCDVDSKMANEAADLIADRQVSKKRPRIFGDYRKMLADAGGPSYGLLRATGSAR